MQALRKELIRQGFLPDVNVQAQQRGGFVQILPRQRKRVPVQFGVTKDTLVEVFGNLNAGDSILLKGSEELKEGIKIEQ